MAKIKTQVVLPRELLEELNRHVKPGQRSEFIVEAVWEKLKKERFKKAFREASGVWNDEEHPDLNSDEDMEKYLQAIRVGLNERNQRWQGT